MGARLDQDAEGEAVTDAGMPTYSDEHEDGGL